MDLNEQFDWVISFACLHWVIDHRPVLQGNSASVATRGATLITVRRKRKRYRSCSGCICGNRPAIWVDYFVGFTFPWGFHSPDEYRLWLEEAGFTVTHLALVPKDMTHEGRSELEGWMRTAWTPYWQRVPNGVAEEFLDEIAEDYLKSHPTDAEGLVHLPMVRLEVEGGHGTDVRATMKDVAKTVGNLIDHANVSIIGSSTRQVFPIPKPCFLQERGTESSTSTSRPIPRPCSRLVKSCFWGDAYSSGIDVERVASAARGRSHTLNVGRGVAYAARVHVHSSS